MTLRELTPVSSPPPSPWEPRLPCLSPYQPPHSTLSYLHLSLQASRTAAHLCGRKVPVKTHASSPPKEAMGCQAGWTGPGALIRAGRVGVSGPSDPPTPSCQLSGPPPLHLSLSTLSTCRLSTCSLSPPGLSPPCRLSLPTCRLSNLLSLQPAVSPHLPSLPTCHPSFGFAGSPEDSFQRPHRLPQCFFGKSSCRHGLALKKRAHNGFGVSHKCPSTSLAPPTPTLPTSSPKIHEEESPSTSAPSAAPATGGGGQRGPCPFPHQPQHSHTVHRQ